MIYEDMTLVQLQSLCKSRGLGTGRSKQVLLKKLTDADIEEVQNMTEDEIDELFESGEPVEIEPAPQGKSTHLPKDQGPEPYRVSYPHVGFLLDSDHERFRRLTWEAAIEDGVNPFGGPTSPRLISSANDTLIYEIEVQ